MGLFNKKQKNAQADVVYKMITSVGNGFYAWNGKLYHSDIVRSCIKPRTKALGKMAAKHIVESVTEKGNTEIKVNPKPYIRLMLEEPNEYMTFQMMIEKVVNQLALNGNAFILILRNAFDTPVGLYPIMCTSVEAKYLENDLYLKFIMQNGKPMMFKYTDIIHLRDDFMNNELFGDNPTEALTSIMEVVNTTDQGVIKAIKNGAMIRWLLKFSNSMRPEDLKDNAQAFADNYLSMSTNSMGVAATDSKSEAVQISPNDYVPNAAQTDRSTKRIYNFFGVNEKIINSNFTEDEWVAYYESVLEPIAVQMANEFTRKLFTRKERAFGNKIIFECSNLTYASMSTKLQLANLVDRAIISRNEARYYLNLPPLEGEGDLLLLRKDTGVVSEGGE